MEDGAVRFQFLTVCHIGAVLIGVKGIGRGTVKTVIREKEENLKKRRAGANSVL